MASVALVVPTAPGPRAEPSVVISINLAARDRADLNAVAARQGLPSRAAVIREAARLLIRAAEGGGTLAGHVRLLDRARTGEGVHFPLRECEALDAAAEKLGVSRGAALRWACDELVAAVLQETPSDQH